MHISADVFQHVLLPFCDFSSLFFLSHCNRDFRKRIIQHRREYKPILRQIESRLDHVFPGLRRIVLESGAIVSGGFLVHAIVDKALSFTDVDVYVHHQDPMLSQGQVPYELFCYGVSIHSSKIPYNYTHHNRLEDHDEYVGFREMGINATQDFHAKNGKTLQVIVMQHHIVLPEFIQRHFDLDICANYYDGRKVVIENAAGLATRTMQKRKNVHIFFESTFEIRIKKYQKRGFRFLPAAPERDALEPGTPSAAAKDPEPTDATRDQ